MNTSLFFRHLLKPTPFRVGAAAAFVAAVVTYALYFTPQQRAVRGRLSDADRQAAAAIDARLKPVYDLFAKGRKGTRPFAQSALSWGGKWALVQGFVYGDTHHKFLADEFGRHVFTPDELKNAIEGACRAYASDLDGVEGQMLVKLRADLADPDRPEAALPPHLKTNEAFAQEYRALASKLVDQSATALAVTVGREVATMVASQAATAAAIQAARAAAAEMGVQGGVLAAGASSTVVTLGVGAVVAIIIDYLLDMVFQWAGYDPEAEVAAAVVDSLDKMESALLRDVGAFGSGKPGSLRAEMGKLHEARSKLRSDVVYQLVEGGAR